MADNFWTASTGDDVTETNPTDIEQPTETEQLRMSKWLLPEHAELAKILRNVIKKVVSIVENKNKQLM